MSVRLRNEIAIVSLLRGDLFCYLGTSSWNYCISPGMDLGAHLGTS
jgi:hypothetical protein